MAQTPQRRSHQVRRSLPGLDAIFAAVFVPSAMEGSGKAKVYADSMVDLVRSVDCCPLAGPLFALADLPADVVRLAPTGKVLLAMGMENGAADRGTPRRRCDFVSSTAVAALGGTPGTIISVIRPTIRQEVELIFSRFGVKLIAEMNRCGMMIDVSHVSDGTFYQVVGRFHRAGGAAPPILRAGHLPPRFQTEHERSR